MSSAELVARAEAEDYAAWFRALADGTRVKIVTLLARHGRPMKVGEIVAAVQVGQSTVSQHLKVLAAVRFVLAERRGTARYYRINTACVDRFPTAAHLVGGLAAPVPEQDMPLLAPFPGPISLAIRPCAARTPTACWRCTRPAWTPATPASRPRPRPGPPSTRPSCPVTATSQPPMTPANCWAGSPPGRSPAAVRTPGWWSTRCTWRLRHAGGASAAP